MVDSKRSYCIFELYYRFAVLWKKNTSPCYREKISHIGRLATELVYNRNRQTLNLRTLLRVYAASLESKALNGFEYRPVYVLHKMPFDCILLQFGFEIEAVEAIQTKSRTKRRSRIDWTLDSILVHVFDSLAGQLKKCERYECEHIRRQLHNMQPRLSCMKRFCVSVVLVFILHSSA